MSVELLQRLCDDAQIRDVLARYARGVDRMDAALVRSCYHDDAVDHHGIFDGIADEFVPWVMAEVQKCESTMHFLGQVLIEYPDGRPDVAAVETYAVAFHRVAGGAQRNNWSSGFRYLDRFERRRDGAGQIGPWKIAERTVVGEWIRIEAGADERPFARGMDIGHRDRTDLVYSLIEEAQSPGAPLG